MAGLMQPTPAAAPPQAAPTPDPTQQAPGAAPAPADAQAPQQPQGPPLTDGPVDPDTFQKMTANCMNAVTGSLKTILKMIADSSDKPQALAQATVQVLLRVEDSFEQSGGKLVLTMSFNAGAETLIDIADAAAKAGVHEFGQKEIEAAFLQAVDQYRVVRAQQGRIDQAQMKQQLEQMKVAADDGSLEKQFPGLDKFKEQAAQGQQQPQQPGASPGAAPTEAAPPDDEDAQDGGADDATEGDAGAPAAPAAAPKAKSNNFPAAMLKKEKAPAKAKPKGKAKPKKGGI